MLRRQFIALLVGASAALPFAAPAAAQTGPVIGFLNSASREAFAGQLAAFHQGLNKGGYVAGQNVAVEYRWADGQYDQLPALAADLVRLKPTLIVATGGGISLKAARAATATIPILALSGAAPFQLDVSSGPGSRNITGVELYTTILAPKRFEFLRELAPTAAKVALLVNPVGAVANIEIRDIGTAARDAGLQLRVLKVGTESEFAPAVAGAVQDGANALLVSADPFFFSRRAAIVALAARHRLLAVYPWREYVEAGGLMSYGPKLSDAYREVGRMASRVLNGATPANLPIQSPQKFELAINLRTAKALGLTLSSMLLARVDDAIE
jgi:putative ABC transport system substrate-binding protein